MKRAGLVLCIGAAAAMFGCVSHNGRNVVGDSYTPAMFARSDFPIKSQAVSSDGPSLTGLSRENWGIAPFIVPVDGAAHRPVYADSTPSTDRVSRQRGDYPTVLSAVDGAGEGYWPLMGEAFMSHVYAAGDFVMLPYRLIREAPWAGPVRGTPQPYWRAPVSESRTGAIGTQQAESDGQSIGESQ